MGKALKTYGMGHILLAVPSAVDEGTARLILKTAKEAYECGAKDERAMIVSYLRSRTYGTVEWLMENIEKGAHVD